MFAVQIRYLVTRKMAHDPNRFPGSSYGAWEAWLNMSPLDLMVDPFGAIACSKWGPFVSKLFPKQRSQWA